MATTGVHRYGKYQMYRSYFLSSAADNMNIVMAVTRGADDFIAKPFDMHVLTVKIQAILRLQL